MTSEVRLVFKQMKLWGLQLHKWQKLLVWPAGFEHKQEHFVINSSHLYCWWKSVCFWVSSKCSLVSFMSRLSKYFYLLCWCEEQLFRRPSSFLKSDAAVCTLNAICFWPESQVPQKVAYPTHWKKIRYMNSISTLFKTALWDNWPSSKSYDNACLFHRTLCFMLTFTCI